MNNWINFPLYASSCIGLWSIAILGFLFAPQKHRQKIGLLFSALGLSLLCFFIVNLWLKLERPPLRTLGETRLWYTFFLASIGLLCYARWRMSWLMIYALLMGILFLTINLLTPQTYNRALMPALQSPWFIPHVIVYIFSYAILAASSLIALKGLYLAYKKKVEKKELLQNLAMADQIVIIGFAFLSLGLLFGALWAKEAWGHYWTWDPKETWAFLTWFSYLIYIHYRHLHRQQIKPALWILSFSFVVLLGCWFGVNYLPAAKTSVHTYSQQQ